jgi:hypothetical protein
MHLSVAATLVLLSAANVALARQIPGQCIDQANIVVQIMRQQGVGGRLCNEGNSFLLYSQSLWECVETWTSDNNMHNYCDDSRNDFGFALCFCWDP